jgi:hypothetical protein
MRPTTLKIPVIVSTAFAGFAAFVALAGNARAQSCGMGVVDWYVTEHAAVARAEDMLQHAKPRDAAWELQRMWPRMHEAVPVASSVPVISSGVRLMALAAVRADGDIRSELGWSSATPRERAANVAWGISRLRMIVAASAWDLVAKNDLGEALARSSETQEEARTMLEALDTAQSILTPEAYAALAAVRANTGDTTGAGIAADECETRAFDAGAQCAVARTARAPAVTAAR